MIIKGGRMAEFSVFSQTKNVREIGEKIKVLCEEYHLKGNFIEDVIIAVDEAVTNIMLHGYQGRCDGIINICCKVEPDRLELKLRDEGRVFDVPCFNEIEANKKKTPMEKGGYGLILMNKFMDDIVFSYDEKAKENTLIMKKYF